MLEKLKGEYTATITSLETQLREAQKAKGMAETAKTELETKLDQCKNGQASGEQISALTRILQAIFGKK